MKPQTDDAPGPQFMENSQQDFTLPVHEAIAKTLSEGIRQCRVMGQDGSPRSRHRPASGER
jgi:hypothetical protein